MVDIITTPHVTISVPFINNNDSVRNQMAASQSRQAIPLVKPEEPIVQTTLERSRILEDDIIRAKEDCEVIYSSYKIIVTKSTNDKFSYYYVDYTYTIPEIGKTVKKGDILAYKTGYFTEDGTLAQGKNLLCSIVVHPWSYEDAIILRKDVDLTSIDYKVFDHIISKNQFLLSLDKDRYKIIPEVGDVIKAYDPILIIKKANANDILREPEIISYKHDLEIIHVDFVANDWYRDLRDYSVAVLAIKEQQENLRNKLRSMIKDDLILNEVLKREYLLEGGPYEYGKEKFDLFIRIIGKIYEPIERGDKLTNRHAAKGVVSNITDTIFITSDGRQVDINIDLMSIISRMNIGQLFELVAGNCIYHLEKKLKTFDDINKAKEYILGFYKTIDNTETKWITKQCQEQLDDINTLEDIHNLKLTFPAPPFESSTRQQLLNACIYLNPDLPKNFEAYFKQDSYDELPDLSPLLEKVIMPDGTERYASVGYVYFYKLVHKASEKIAARSGGKLSKKTLQPVSGRRQQGGQRFGEMEVWALLAYDAILNLKEISGLKSDDLEKKINHIIKQLYGSDVAFKGQDLETVKLLKAYLSVLRARLVEKE